MCAYLFAVPLPRPLATTGRARVAEWLQGGRSLALRRVLSPSQSHDAPLCVAVPGGQRQSLMFMYIHTAFDGVKRGVRNSL